MRRKKIIALVLTAATMLSGVLAAKMVPTFLQERKTKRVTRVKRPQFTEKDWDGIYFRDLFDEGLVGERPEKATPGQSTANPTQVAQAPEDSPATSFAWSKFVSGSVIEDEVKAQQRLLAQNVTTPVKFKSEYANVHQTFSMISMLFAVIREYDGDVRWKKFAADAQFSFEKAANNSRVGTPQAFEFSKTRKADLAEMVRGGNFESNDNPPEALDWSAVVDRIPIMKRLQLSKDSLKQMSSNKGQFENGVEQILHEAELSAVMARVLMKENMTDADDEGYLALAKALSDAAIEAREACKNQDYDSVAKAINLIDQSCNNCHDEWK